MVSRNRIGRGRLRVNDLRAKWLREAEAYLEMCLDKPVDATEILYPVGTTLKSEQIDKDSK